MHILSIIRIIGILVMCFSGTMLIPAFVALIYDDGGGKAFMQAFSLSLVHCYGGCVIITNKNYVRVTVF